ncbi:MAG: AraC family transcriptional regulator [Kofleriaceae bacterium]
MPEMVRAAGLRGFHALVTQLGGDPEALLRRHRVPVAPDEDVLVPVRKIVRLLEDSARALGCRDFGLRLAATQDISILGPVAVAIQNSPTFGEALRVASRYLFVHNQAMSFTPVLDGLADRRHAELRYAVPTPGLAPARQSFDLMMGGGHRILTVLGGRHYRPVAVHLSHAALAAPAVYRRYFGVPVLFEQPTARLIVSRALFDAPVPQANETLRNLATSYLDQHFDRSPNSVLPRVRMAIRRALGTPQAGLGRVAAQLAMHPRTLQRHLADEGATFEAIREAVCREAALRLLRNRRLSLSEISARLGLSEQSALTRSCKRWFGEPPSAIRRRLAPDEQA